MKKLLKKAAAFAAAACLSLVSAPAWADNMDFTNAHGGTGAYRSGYWRYATGDDAWAQFVARSGRSSEGSVVRLLRGTGYSDNDINICRSSKVVWWVSDHSNTYWLNPWKGYTNGGRSNVGSLNQASRAAGRSVTQDEIDQYYNWSWYYNGNSAFQNPGPNLVCGGAFLRYDEERTGIPEYRNRLETSTQEVSGRHSYTTTLAPMKIDGVYPGGGQYEVQNSVKKTRFGELYDSLAAGSTTLTPEQVKAEAESRIAADDADPYSGDQVELSEKNKAAFAKGGVISVYEHAVKAKLSLSKTDTVSEVRYCTQKRTFDGRWWSAWYNTSCSDWAESGRYDGQTYVQRIIQTPKNTGFLQMISVHCNKAGFDALVAATGASVVSEGDPERGISAVARSKTYDSQTLDFGHPYHADPAAAASGKLGFFDKECPFDCTNSADPAQGASADNGATGNTGDGSGTSEQEEVTGLTGARSGSVIGNSFQFFRDNVDSTIKLDTWYPRSTGTVHYKGEAPVTTTFSRWDQGTPDVSGKDGGKFTATAVRADGTTRTLFNGKHVPATQKNWDTSPFSGPLSTQMGGLVREVKVRASWASEPGRPQVINAKWEYAPQVSTMIPQSYGFSHAAGGRQAQVGPLAQVDTPIQGKCYAAYGTSTGVDTVDMFQQATGTGTENTLDGSIIGGVTNPETVSTNLVASFVRSTTE